ncbi:MAG: hypothetical protein KBT28_03665 [Bacteroidales bacterium]|nr:hypothetical protein [Candidatus Colimorpha merdihippi]
MSQEIPFGKNEISPLVRNFTTSTLLALSFVCSPSVSANTPSGIVNDGILFNIGESNPVINRMQVSRLERRLNKLVEIYLDEEDAAPISELAISNTKKILVTENNSLLKDWDMFSNDKGAITLEYQRRENARATICISDTQISYFLEKKNRMQVYGIEPFSEEAVCSILKKVI